MNGVYNYRGNYFPIGFPNTRWNGKKIVFFGDSRTWYDGNAYVNTAKDEWVGKICIGYQKYVRDYLGIDTINQGVSGDSVQQICTRIKAYDFTGADAVFFAGGINDWNADDAYIGTIQPIGSTFDTSTVYGSWQSAIEYIGTNYPTVKILLCTPFIAWIGGVKAPYEKLNGKIYLGDLYNIPCLDLYKKSGINETNRGYYYCDDLNKTDQWYLHFNDYGNKLIGDIIAGFIANN